MLFFLFGVSITAYVERILLAQYSENALAGSLNGFFLSRVFQFSTLAVIIGGQTFVGLFHGSKQQHQIGPCIWQLIWFSLGTALVVPPAGFLLEHLFYHDTLIAQSEGGYFSLLCWFNFLFPLVGALSAFYIGRGKTALIVFLTLGGCLLNIALDYVLIFGNAYIPALGTLGASLGKVISQGFICLVLGILFLRSSNHQLFCTRDFAFQPLLFAHYIKPGLFRALGSIFCFIDWSIVSRTMTVKSGLHMLVYSIGVTVFYFFTFFADALFQSMVTLVATQIGQKQSQAIWKTVYNGLFIMLSYALLLCVPFFFFPEVLTLCFKATPFANESLEVMHSIIPSLWLALLGYGVSVIPLSLIVASRDTKFLSFYYSLFWIVSSLSTYLLMVVFDVGADKFWYIVFFSMVVTTGVLFKRVSQRRWTAGDWEPQAVKLEVG